MLKRTFDILASLLGLIFLSPVLVPIGLLIRGADGGPIFYSGVRSFKEIGDVGYFVNL